MQSCKIKNIIVLHEISLSCGSSELGNHAFCVFLNKTFFARNSIIWGNFSCLGYADIQSIKI